MNIKYLFEMLNERNISLSYRGDKLLITALKNRVIDKSVLNEIRKNKKEIIKILKMHVAIPEIKIQKSYDLSHAQKRLWILDKIEGGGNIAYNIPGACVLEGRLDEEALGKAYE